MLDGIGIGQGRGFRIDQVFHGTVEGFRQTRDQVDARVGNAAPFQFGDVADGQAGQMGQFFLGEAMGFAVFLQLLRKDMAEFGFFWSDNDNSFANRINVW